MKRKIAFIDYSIDEWHANHAPGIIAKSSLADEFEIAGAWEKTPGPTPLKKLRTVGILMLKVPLLPDAGQGRRKYVRYRSQLAVLVRGIPRNVGGAGYRTTTQYTNSQLLHGQINSC